MKDISSILVRQQAKCRNRPYPKPNLIVQVPNTFQFMSTIARNSLQLILENKIGYPFHPDFNSLIEEFRKYVTLGRPPSLVEVAAILERVGLLYSLQCETLYTNIKKLEEYIVSATRKVLPVSVSGQGDFSKEKRKRRSPSPELEQQPEVQINGLNDDLESDVSHEDPVIIPDDSDTDVSQPASELDTLLATNSEYGSLAIDIDDIFEDLTNFEEETLQPNDANDIEIAPVAGNVTPVNGILDVPHINNLMGSEASTLTNWSSRLRIRSRTSRRFLQRKMVTRDIFSARRRLFHLSSLISEVSGNEPDEQTPIEDLTGVQSSVPSSPRQEISGLQNGLLEEANFPEIEILDEFNDEQLPAPELLQLAKLASPSPSTIDPSLLLPAGIDFHLDDEEMASILNFQREEFEVLNIRNYQCHRLIFSNTGVEEQPAFSSHMHFIQNLLKKKGIDNTNRIRTRTSADCRKELSSQTCNMDEIAHETGAEDVELCKILSENLKPITEKYLEQESVIENGENIVVSVKEFYHRVKMVLEQESKNPNPFNIHQSEEKLMKTIRDITKNKEQVQGEEQGELESNTTSQSSSQESGYCTNYTNTNSEESTSQSECEPPIPMVSLDDVFGDKELTRVDVTRSFHTLMHLFSGRKLDVDYTEFHCEKSEHEVQCSIETGADENLSGIQIAKSRCADLNEDTIKIRIRAGTNVPEQVSESGESGIQLESMDEGFINFNEPAAECSRHSGYLFSKRKNY